MTEPRPADLDLTAIERAVADAPFDSYALRRLAVTYLQLSRPVEAVPLFVRVLEGDSNPGDHVNLLYARGQAALQILERKAQAAAGS
ncbi:MAG: hypothetical protein ACOVVK_10740 [Elsteraceae bacterium]